jgi:hypothetical protein
VVRGADDLPPADDLRGQLRDGAVRGGVEKWKHLAEHPTSGEREAPSGQLLGGGVHANDAPGRIRGDHGIADAVQGRGQVLGLAQSVLGALAAHERAQLRGHRRDELDQVIVLGTVLAHEELENRDHLVSGEDREADRRLQPHPGGHPTAGKVRVDRHVPDPVRHSRFPDATRQPASARERRGRAGGAEVGERRIDAVVLLRALEHGLALARDPGLSEVPPGGLGDQAERDTERGREIAGFVDREGQCVEQTQAGLGALVLQDQLVELTRRLFRDRFGLETSAAFAGPALPYPGQLRGLRAPAARSDHSVRCEKRQTRTHLSSPRCMQRVCAIDTPSEK